MSGQNFRRTHASGAKQGLEPAQRFGEAIRIAQAGLKKIELLLRLTGGRGGEPHADDRCSGAEIFQMRVQRAQQQFDVARRFGNAEAALVPGAVLEAQFEGKRFCDEIHLRQSHFERVQKTVQHEEQGV